MKHIDDDDDDDLHNVNISSSMCFISSWTQSFNCCVNKFNDFIPDQGVDL